MATYDYFVSVATFTVTIAATAVSAIVVVVSDIAESGITTVATSCAFAGSRNQLGA